MGCGGSMLRTSMQPLAHLVDAAAEKWLAAEDASELKRRAVREEITQQFRIGDNRELTFHGQRYLLRVFRVVGTSPAGSSESHVEVHEISVNT